MSARRPVLGCISIVLFGVQLGCPPARPYGFEVPPADGAEVIDPVSHDRCSKSVDRPTAVFEERTYYFCSTQGHDAFVNDPVRYADRG